MVSLLLVSGFLPQEPDGAFVETTSHRYHTRSVGKTVEGKVRRSRSWHRKPSLAPPKKNFAAAARGTLRGAARAPYGYAGEHTRGAWLYPRRLV